MLATYVLFYLMTTFTLTYGTRPASLDAAKAAAEKAGKPMTEAAAAAFVPGLGYTRNDFLWMLIAGVVFFGIFTLVSGPLAEKYGRRKMLIAVTGRHLRLRPAVRPAVQRRLRGHHGAADHRLLPDGPDLRPHGCAAAGTVPRPTSGTPAPPSATTSPASWARPWRRSSPSRSGNWPTAAPCWWVSTSTSMAVLTLIALFLSKETRDLDYENNVA